MSVQTPTVLKTYFETGDKPTQSQFENLIDSTANTLITGDGTVNSSNVLTVTHATTADTVTTNANLTGDVTSSGNATTIATNAVETAMIEDLAVTNAKLAKIVISTPTFSVNSYTLALTDDGKFLQLSNGATAGNLEIPLNATVAFEIGTQILSRQTGSGLITIKSTAGATIQSEGASTSNRSFASQYSSISLIKVATNTWSISGNLA